MSDEKSSLFGSSAQDPKTEPLYKDNKGKILRYVLGSFMGVVGLKLVISIILISLQAAKKNGLYALLLISLLSFAQVEVFLAFFILRGHLPRSYVWSLFVVGAIIIVEAVFTDVIVYQIDQ